MNLYYEGYMISDQFNYLNEKQINILSACVWMVDNKQTIRTTAKKFQYSTTTFWRRIHNECRILSPELYDVVKNQMKKNLIKRKRRKK